MLISEQKYTNKNRIYYRGLKEEDLAKKGFKEIYLTTNVVYALSYATINGTIEAYHLKDSLNIFNMRSKQDEANLRKFCNSHIGQYKNYLKLFDNLKNNDWSEIVGGSVIRQPLIIAIKSLGYDGYFNYEIDSRYFELTKKYFWNTYEKAHVNFPAIAIFDESKIEKVDILRADKILQNEKIKKINQQEKGFVLSLKEKNFNLIKEKTLTLTDEEITKILKMKSLSEEQISLFLENLRWNLGGY